MHAVRCERYGEPEGLVLRDIPDPPEPGRGRVKVRVRAAALNFPDLLVIGNRYQVSVPTPFTPGSEFAGEVVAVGADVDGLLVGQRVAGSVMSGAFCEYIDASADALTAVPASLDWPQAAAFRVTHLTAYHALVTFGGLEAGQQVIALGAAGGVGSAVVAVATALGASVIAAARSKERLETATALGATNGIAYAEEDLKARIKDLTGGGADLVVDPVGGEYAEQALRALRWGGTFVCVGFATGEIPRIPLNLVLLKNVTVRGMELRSVESRLPEQNRAADAALAELVDRGLRPAVSAVYPLADAGQALRDMADRRVTGKIVLTME